MERIDELTVPQQDVSAVSHISPNVRVKALDGVRAVAIAFVVIGHVAGAAFNIEANHFKLADGVSIFFVLSGFLITSLLLRELDTFGRLNLKQFYLRRIQRIFPAFYALLAVIGLLGLVKMVRFQPIELISAAAFLNNFVATRSWWLGHTWSLCIEEQFYLLWPLVIAVGGRKLGIRFAFAIIALDPIIRIASYFKFPALRDHLPIMLHTRADTLMYGCIVALMIDEPRFEAAMKSLSKIRFEVFACAFYFIVDPILNSRYGGAYYLTVGYTLEGFSIATMLFWIISQPNASIVRILSKPPVVFVGVISYSLYLWQQPFLAPRNIAFAGNFPINIVLAVAAAVASYQFIERPFLNRRKVGEPVATTALGAATV